MQGFTLRGLKFMNVTKQHAETHYADLSSKPFFGGALRLGRGGAEIGCSLVAQHGRRPADSVVVPFHPT